MFISGKSSTFAARNTNLSSVNGLIVNLFMLFSAQYSDLRLILPWIRIRREQRAMRAIAEQRRRIMTKEEVAADSALIMEQLEKMSAFRDAKVILMYYPIHNEVDLRPLLTKYSDKTFLLPVTHRRSMEVRPYDGEDMMRKGRMGVPEPQTSTYKGAIDLIIVPGTLFDQHCHRIGRGGGYYDRFLRKHPYCKKIGVCYAFQLKKHTIPHLWLDQKVDRVVTPQKTIGL